MAGDNGVWVWQGNQWVNIAQPIGIPRDYAFGFVPSGVSVAAPPFSSFHDVLSPEAQKRAEALQRLAFRQSQARWKARERLLAGAYLADEFAAGLDE